jgi:DNA-binding response OmpR family regulator
VRVLLADTIAEGLRKLAMAVDVCHDGQAALDRLSVNHYDVAVIDRDSRRAPGTRCAGGWCASGCRPAS